MIEAGDKYGGIKTSGFGTHKCQSDQVKTGDFLSEVNYVKVTGKNDDYTFVKTSRGDKWSISHSVVPEAYTAHNQYHKTVVCNQAELAQRLKDVRSDVFTVVFEKKVASNKVIVDSLRVQEFNMETDGARKLSSKMAKARKGEIRTLTGYLHDTNEEVLGRLNVVDLGLLPWDTPNISPADILKAKRLVDLRTLHQLIHKGVRYTRL